MRQFEPIRILRYTAIIFLEVILHVATGAFAQPADTLLSGFAPIHSFREARAIASDPAGMIYIVDQGLHRIFRKSPQGQEFVELGGPGISEGQFDQPADIDPTNGLVLVVADAGNGRIQRFSREFLFLESLRLGDYSRNQVSAFPDQPRYRQDEGTGSYGDGRPIAVRTTPNNEMYAIDAAQQVVVKWDRDRNVSEVIGGYDQGDGALREPVALELGADRSIYVLDRMRDEVLVYDPYGGYIRSMAVGLCSEAVALIRVEDLIIVLLPDRMHFFQERGRLLVSVRFELPDDATDMLLFDNEMYVLTQTSLHHAEVDLGAILKLGTP